ncbi:MAG: T9SS type A sorting domain-containing protein [Bacteroidetes bacterium]|nr:T9SS type A sorting domain-containing protein [Bacteroidota bacterium]
MKTKIFTPLLLLMVAALLPMTAAAQSEFETWIEDSVITGTTTGQDYRDDVWYSLKNGEVHRATRNNWHLGLSTGTFDVNIITHHAAGSPSLYVFRVPFDTTGFGTSALDTSGQMINANLYFNNESDWREGAFSQTRVSGALGFGWGEYDMTTHNVYGDSVYVVKYGSNYKKVAILHKGDLRPAGSGAAASTYGQWRVRVANLDGSEDTTYAINSTAYSTKKFVYINLETRQVIDREPAANSWDLLFTKYFEDLGPGVGWYQVAGVKHNTKWQSAGPGQPQTNAGVKAARIYNLTADNLTEQQVDSITPLLKDSITAIGRDKTIGTLSFIIKDNDGLLWQLYYTSIKNATTQGRGEYFFQKRRLTAPANRLGSRGNGPSWSLYPNPSAGDVTLVIENATANTQVVVRDLMGRVVMSQTLAATDLHALNLRHLAPATYVVSVQSGNRVSSQKLVITQ